jgi:hypothetical protein
MKTRLDETNFMRRLMGLSLLNEQIKASEVGSDGGDWQEWESHLWNFLLVIYKNSEITNKLIIDSECDPIKNACNVINSKEVLGLNDVVMTRGYLLFPNIPTKYNVTKDFYPDFSMSYMNDKPKSLNSLIEYINWVKGGNIPLSMVDEEEGYDAYKLYLDNPLKNYDAYISQIRYHDNIEIRVTFISKDENQKVKKFVMGGGTLRKGYASVFMYDTQERGVKKPYRIEGDEIFFEKDDKSTKGVKRATGDEQLLSIAVNDDWEGVSMGKEKYVNIGTRGSVVKEIQHKLLNSGLSQNFNLTNNIDGCKQSEDYCDGVFGKGTKRAVEEFQKKYDLTVDGIVGPDTANALYTN